MDHFGFMRTRNKFQYVIALYYDIALPIIPNQIKSYLGTTGLFCYISR